MRGYQAPGKRLIPSEMQSRFGTLARGRRSKMAKVAGTTLLKADQWARGGVLEPAVTTSLETQLDKLKKPT
jgi:hypothetical protein